MNTNTYNLYTNKIDNHMNDLLEIEKSLLTTMKNSVKKILIIPVVLFFFPQNKEKKKIQSSQNVS